MNPKIKAARRKHKLKREVGSWLAILAITVVVVMSHFFQWNMAREAGLSITQTVLVIVLAWLCVIGFIIVPIWRHFNK